MEEGELNESLPGVVGGKGKKLNTEEHKTVI